MKTDNYSNYLNQINLFIIDLENNNTNNNKTN